MRARFCVSAAAAVAAAFFVFGQERGYAQQEAAAPREPALVAGCPRASQELYPCAKAKAQAMNDGASGDLGDVTLSQLPPQLLTAVQNQEIGKFTPPLRTPKGYLLLMVCERKEPTENLPSRDDMANKIGFERMDQQQRRYLRYLRASAYVDIRA